MKSQRFDIHISIERHVSLIACFSLFLILIFGSVSSSSNAYADDVMGMPSPQDAPATTDAITAGGGPDNGDDDENDDDTGGSQDSDDDNDNDKDKDNDKDDEPVPKDAPSTTDTLIAKKLECPKGQEVALFSTTCEPTDGLENPGSTEDATLAATTCPTGITPSSYRNPDGLLFTSALWGNSPDDYGIKIEKPDNQRIPLHWVASPVVPRLKADDFLSDPSFRSMCTGKPVTVASPDKKNTTTYDPDGTKLVVKHDPLGDPVNMTDFDSNGNRKSESHFDPATGNPKSSHQYDPRYPNSLATISIYYNPQTKKPDSILEHDHDTRISIGTEYDPKTNKPAKITKSDPLRATETVTDFDPISGKPKATEEYYINPDIRAKLRDISYAPGTDKQASVTDYNVDGKPKMKIDYNPDTGLPSTTTTFNPTTGKPDMQIKFKEDGVTPDGPALHYDKDGNLQSK